jgi:hypothetical protein
MSMSRVRQLCRFASIFAGFVLRLRSGAERGQRKKRPRPASSSTKRFSPALSCFTISRKAQETGIAQTLVRFGILVAQRSPERGRKSFSCMRRLGNMRAKRRAIYEAYRMNRLLQEEDSLDLSPVARAIENVTGCRWPSGDKEEFKFCDAPRIKWSSYCAVHAPQGSIKGVPLKNLAVWWS